MSGATRSATKAIEQAATGKRINRIGGRTSMVSQLSGKSKSELQTIIRNLKNKKDKNATDKASLKAAESKLRLIRAKESAEVGKSTRKMQQGVADTKSKSVSLPEMKKGTPDREMNKGSLVQPKSSQTGLKKLPTAVRNKMGYMNRGGLAKSGSKDMRKGGMFY
tara:strand:- start:667 stop:1158 length:492 start_codon:yes stop_codon:yes gene_type:complete